MNPLFEQLFLAWCPPYDESMIPPYLRGDPVRAYGQYAFQKGFRLALSLVLDCLDREGD